MMGNGGGQGGGEGGGVGCLRQPSVLFLLGTVGLTGFATAVLCFAIMTDRWEYVSWDLNKIEEIAAGRAQNNNLSKDYQVLVDSYLDRYVTRVAIRKLFDSPDELVTAVFLVPMHGGIWTLCVSLTEEQIMLLSTVGFNQSQCINYLPPLFQKTEEPEQRPDWQHRMQNLSISCALVCLIILGSSALVGAFGVLKHQISAVLVTGVMYLLAATFALFTLTIIHLKRQQSKSRPTTTTTMAKLNIEDDCVDWPISPLHHHHHSASSSILGDGVSPANRTALEQIYRPIWAEYYPARVYSVGWSLDLGWAGVTLCVLTSVLWIFLSKIMRYNPISTSLLTTA